MDEIVETAEQKAAREESERQYQEYLKLREADRKYLSGNQNA